MQCPKCGGRGLVTSTFTFGTTVQRYRRCPLCDHRWKAWEEIDPNRVRPKKSATGTQADDLFSINDDETVS